VNARDLLTLPLRQPVADASLALFVRIALAAPFFLSGRTKLAEGSWFEISDTTYLLFENDYSGVPLPPHFAAVAATVSEHLWPLLLVLGLATRLSAAALIGMSMVIQIFVYPDAWWNLHMTWVALGLIILVMGPGRYSLDHALFARKAA
jgi:putative oxidoreductase